MNIKTIFKSTTKNVGEALAPGFIKSSSKTFANNVAESSIKASAEKGLKGAANIATDMLTKAKDMTKDGFMYAAKKMTNLSGTQFVVLASSLAAGGYVIVQAVDVEIKNNTPLTITAIKNGATANSVNVQFENPKDIQLFSADQLTITGSNCVPIIDGRYTNTRIISSTEIELTFTSKLTSPGTAGTIDAHGEILTEVLNPIQKVISMFTDPITEIWSSITEVGKIIIYIVLGILAAILVAWCIMKAYPLFNRSSFTNRMNRGMRGMQGMRGMRQMRRRR